MEKKITPGFTLIELVVAVTLLALVLGGAVGVEVQGIKLVALARHRQQSIGLANEQLNLVKTIRDNNLFNDESPFTGIDINSNPYKVVSDGDNWKLEQKADPSEGEKTLDNKKFQIEVFIEQP